MFNIFYKIQTGLCDRRDTQFVQLVTILYSAMTRNKAIEDYREIGGLDHYFYSACARLSSILAPKRP